MHHPQTLNLGHAITLIDSGMHRPGLAACYLLISGNEAVFIETGTSHSVPGMLDALAAAGLGPEQVRYIIPTHVHLDHAGGVGALMQQCTNAQLAIHPRGAPHMIDPSKLYAGATAVYGEATMRKVYGDIPAVPKERVLVMDDGSQLEFGNSRKLIFLDTPGHARHHSCIFDERSQGFFTGDTFGLSYRELDTEKGPYIMPTTTPVQFEPEAWLNSLERMLSFAPTAMYLTHYGKVEDVAKHAEHLKSGILKYVAIAQAHGDANNRHSAIKEALYTHCFDELNQHGCQLDEPRLRDLLELDMELNAQGLEIWLDRKMRA